LITFLNTPCCQTDPKSFVTSGPRVRRMQPELSYLYRLHRSIAYHEAKRVPPSRPHPRKVCLRDLWLPRQNLIRLPFSMTALQSMVSTSKKDGLSKPPVNMMERHVLVQSPPELPRSSCKPGSSLTCIVGETQTCQSLSRRRRGISIQSECRSTPTKFCSPSNH